MSAPYTSLRRLVLSILPLLATATKYKQYVLAPAQRSVTPAILYDVQGDVNNPTGVGNGSTTQFNSVNSSIILDFGKNIAGSVRFSVSALSGDAEFLGFSFSESSLWVIPYECDSGTAAIRDSPLWFLVSKTGDYAADKAHQRGGSRYMGIWHNSTGSITLNSVSVNFTAAPEMTDLQDYQGWFHSDSEKLNRVWYAGAYTNQLCTLDPSTGNALGVPGTNWYYNASIANGTSVLSDGAKRDRLVWPRDIAISGPTMFVSTNSLDGIKNGIDSLFILQQSDGRLPWAGVPFTSPRRFPFSFTYHLYTLLDLYYYYIFTGDVDYVQQYWNQYKLAMNWSLSTIDTTNLANVTSTNDWLRSGMGGHNIEVDAVEDSSVRAGYQNAMAQIKISANQRLFDPAQNLFFDNDTIQTPDSVHPQDGNSWAIVSGLVDQHRAVAISDALKARWVKPYGAPAPEAGPTISPFVSGFEVQAHNLAGHPEYTIELMEFMWGDFMLDDPRMTNSSLIEGYSTNGDLHYAPYDNDARISYAHGWATGPTSALTFYSAGLKVTSGAGKTWDIQPRMGGLQNVDAGFRTPLGGFSAKWHVQKKGIKGHLSTPRGTSGTLTLPKGSVVRGSHGKLRPARCVDGNDVYENVAGGSYRVKH
ncbi:hypothetical protein KVT40_007230 [Elsinoe batatas]|uniref:Alpha-L-rhamnosidase C-terminal domain-containing protein n=1 Tax=Elsinoe batatas TaxID=2601811 RepID=A0A8K0KZ71_9PEZI|nr:hypothetical protein KVT40_007230 [Elsinoe batatas]